MAILLSRAKLSSCHAVVSSSFIFNLDPSSKDEFFRKYNVQHLGLVKKDNEYVH